LLQTTPWLPNVQLSAKFSSFEISRWTTASWGNNDPLGIRRTTRLGRSGIRKLGPTRHAASAKENFQPASIIVILVRAHFFATHVTPSPFLATRELLPYYEFAAVFATRPDANRRGDRKFSPRALARVEQRGGWLRNVYGHLCSAQPAPIFWGEGSPAMAADVIVHPTRIRGVS
jgi:hypothetical protein